MTTGLDTPLLHRTDIITPNETEFALLLERFTATCVDPATLAQREEADLHALARKLGVATVVITLGAYGCFVSHSENLRGDALAHYRLPPEKVKAIDTTGAGDAFSGGLVAALVLLHNAPFRRCIEHANRVAALATETIGTAPAMPTFAAVTHAVGAHGNRYNARMRIGPYLIDPPVGARARWPASPTNRSACCASGWARGWPCPR